MMQHPADEQDQAPAYDADAERAVIAGMIHHRGEIPDVAAILDGSEFYRPVHETVYRAILDLNAAGEPVDPITLTDALRKADDLTRVGGPVAVSQLADISHAVAHPAEYARIVADMAARRKITQALNLAAYRVRSGNGELVDLLADVTTEINGITTSAAPAAGTSGWDFTDLTSVLDGTHKPVTATVGARDDGIGLFYPGRVNGVQGESEAGKSWLALIAALTEINRGNHVVYIDFEDSEDGVVGRLLLIGALPETVRALFHYVRPGGGIPPAAMASFVAKVGEVRPTLVVVDGVTEAMSLMGLELKDNTEIAKFGRLLLRPLADTGAAVVPLDHVVKNSEGRGRYALGGVHKLNAVDGVQYMLEAIKPFGVNTEGRSRLRIAKDRPAQVRKHALPGGRNPLHWYADLVVKSETDTFADAHIYPPIQHPDDPAEQTDEQQKEAKKLAEIEECKGKILAAVGKAREPLTKKGIEDRVQGRASTTRQALVALVDDGRLVAEPGSRGAVLHSIPTDVPA
ncbi:DnaB-like helicase N-terminal domain-containing protein [Streptomyces sp. rh34]|uniref:DnaB-like helicase N-terminal domain-containing protein n=1 Tax=Streptomyces sp. rh34 TaxID=2034272 RepID=UPI000BF0D81D|nr:DnaB-like helicase N-terminal domain-containing protein [Streptomyces sp. rh34]